MRGAVFFDVELSETYDGELDRLNRCPGISCAVTAVPVGASWDKLEYIAWYGGCLDGVPQSEAAEHMEPRELRALLAYLGEQAAQGNVPVTWAGVSFDFKVLAWAANRIRQGKELALVGVDMWYAMLAQLGYASGLSTVAKAMGANKYEELTGADAVRLWESGEREKVIAYCAGDVELTARAFIEGCREGDIRWLTKAGKRSGMIANAERSYRMSNRDEYRMPWSAKVLYRPDDVSWPFMYTWRPVSECMVLPYKPDTSWMDSVRFTPESVTAWLAEGAWWDGGDEADAVEDDQLVQEAIEQFGAVVRGVHNLTAPPHAPPWDVGQGDDGVGQVYDMSALVEASGLLIDYGMGPADANTRHGYEYVLTKRGGEYYVFPLAGLLGPDFVPLGEFVARAVDGEPAGLVRLAELDPELAGLLGGGMVASDAPVEDLIAAL